MHVFVCYIGVRVCIHSIYAQTLDDALKESNTNKRNTWKRKPTVRFLTILVSCPKSIRAFDLFCKFVIAFQVFLIIISA